MDTPLKPLLSSIVDADLEDDDLVPSSSEPPPRYDAPYVSHSEVVQEDELDGAEFIKWWKEVRSQPHQRDAVLNIVRDWSSDDRRRDAILVQKYMTTRTVTGSIFATLVRASCIACGPPHQKTCAYSPS
jgi:hypothetical protein